MLIDGNHEYGKFLWTQIPDGKMIPYPELTPILEPCLHLIGGEGLREGLTKTNVTVDSRSVSRRQSAWIVDGDKLEKRGEHGVIC